MQTMSRHAETNPYFNEPPIPPLEGERSDASHGPAELRPPRQDQPRGAEATQPLLQGQGSKRLGPRSHSRSKASKPQGPRVVPPQPGGYSTPWRNPSEPHRAPYPESHFPLHGDQFHSAWYDNPLHHPEDSQPERPLEEKPKLPVRDNQHVKAPQHGDQRISPPTRTPPRRDHGLSPTQVAVPQHGQDRRRTQPPEQDREHRRYGHGFWMPRPGRTKPITWLAAVFCAIFWIVIFLGGIIVLIVYLVYRPRSPRFEVSSATLNAAYVDAGSLLNADLSLLSNFTNPSKRVTVDFSSVVIDLYYGSTLIATQYIQPFKAARGESRFANIHMISSQVRLPFLESQRLQEQVSRNEVILDVKGVFRVRSYLGSFLRYSYRLYGHCRIMVTSPPNGVLRATKCRTKR